MRWLFIALLLLNLGLFAWFFDTREETPAMPAQPGPGTLTLVGESTSAMGGSCYQSEPLVEEEEAAMLAESYGGQARVVAAEERRSVGYWVFLSPRSSFNAARRELARLRQAGVTDVGLVSESGMANAISLGVYNSEELAQRRHLALSDLGFQARMEQRFRARTYYRVLLTASTIPGDKRVNWEQTDCQTSSD